MHISCDYTFFFLEKYVTLVTIVVPHGGWIYGLKSEARGNNWNIIKLVEEGGKKRGYSETDASAKANSRDFRGRYILGWTSSNHSKGAAA